MNQGSHMQVPHLTWRVGIEFADILHSDLKPDNILLGFSGAPWITDFGLAQQIKDTDPTAERGTVLYKAPEVIERGTPFSFQADVWSFGCVLACILNESEIPYDLTDDEQSRLAAAKKLEDEDARSKALRSLYNSVEREMRVEMRRPVVDANQLLCPVVASCCSREPSHRPSFEIVWQRVGKIQSEVAARGSR